MTPTRKDPLSATGLERKFDDIDTRMKDLAAHRGRKVEDYGMFVALAIAGLYGIGEFLAYVGVVHPTQHSIPWVTLILCFLCIMPKTVGRATTGKAWLFLAEGLGKRVAQPAKPFEFKGDDEKPVNDR